MKKIVILLIYSFSIWTTIQAQDTTTIYFNKRWKITKPEKAQFIQYEIRNDIDKYVVIKMTCDKIPISIINYKSLTPAIEHGKVQYFDSNGKLTISGFYENGYMDSIWYILEDGYEKYDTLNYSGIKELFLNPESNFPFPEIFFIVEEMPIFGDGKINSKEAFRDYVSQNLHYPIRAQNNKIEGRVFIQFIVGPDGKIYTPKIVVDADKDLAFEALRVIRDSPLWTPGKQRNREVALQYTMPIIFILK